MKMNDELEKSFNQQLFEELNSWYIYRATAEWFTDRNLNGFAHWMLLQADEEMVHAERLRKYINLRDNTVHYHSLPAPKADWQKPMDAVAATYHHEVFISGCIDKLAKEAMKHGDLGAYKELQWFIEEQEEEEEQTRTVLEKLQMVGDSNHTLYLLDKEMLKRLK